MRRREFLHLAAALCASNLYAADRPRSQPPPRPTPPTKKLGVVTTAYHYLSHAYHVCGRFLSGYLRDGKIHYPDYGIAGMYVQDGKMRFAINVEAAQRARVHLSSRLLSLATIVKDDNARP